VTSSAAGSAAGGWGSLGPSSGPTSGDVVGGAGPPRAASARWSAARAGSAAARCARPVALAWPSQPQPQAGGAGRGVLAPAGVALQPTRRHRVALRFEYSSSRLGSGAGLRHRPAVVAGLPSRLHPRDGVQLSTLGRPMPVNRCPYKINGSHTRRVFIYNCPNVNPAAAASPAAVRRWGLGIAV